MESVCTYLGATTFISNLVKNTIVFHRNKGSKE